MSDIFKHIIELIFTKTKNNVEKIFYALLIVVLTLVVNDQFGITKHLLLNRRLNLLEKLNTISPEGFERDTVIQQEIASVKRIMFDKITFTQTAKEWINRRVAELMTPRGYSATFILLIVMVIMPLSILFSKENNIASNFAILILMELLFILWAFALFWLQSFLPTLKPILFNHIINLLIQFSSIQLAALLSKTNKKKITVSEALEREALMRMTRNNIVNNLHNEEKTHTE